MPQLPNTPAVIARRLENGSVPRLLHRLAIVSSVALLAVGCSRRTVQPVGATGFTGQAPDVQRLYQTMGLIASGGVIPFVGSVSFLRAPSVDSTLVLVALSLPAHALTFTREGDRYVAVYNARLEIRQGATVVHTIDAKETVRVPTFRETTRTDESIIWQQFLKLTPGAYAVQVGIRDETGIRNSTEEVNIQVPRLTTASLSTPIPIYEAVPRSTVDSLPRLLSRPRNSVTFGVDTVMPVYVEAVGNGAGKVELMLTGEHDMVLWKNTAELEQHGALRNATLMLPVSKMGIGVTTLRMVTAGSSDTVRSRLLVSLGDDLPIGSFDEMLNYLRWFTTSEKLRALRDATPEGRTEAWATLLRSTDPYPNTPENEALRDYFGRIRSANQRFRDDGPVGWQTDRGTAFVALGEPDNIYDSNFNDPSQRLRQQVWEYREDRVQLVFIDQTGFGRWRLGPSGMADLQNAFRRKLSQQQ